MFKVIATDVVISRGYNEQPALRFTEDGSAVRFRVGKSVYDKRAENDRRWININVKAFGELCSRIKKMKLDAGSYIHLEGRYDEDTWQDNGTKHSVPVVILTDIEYAYNGNGARQNSGSRSSDDNNPPTQNQSASRAQPPQEDSQEDMPDSFTGFSSYGGANPFFPQESV